jgi:hypothetical protein
VEPETGGRGYATHTGDRDSTTPADHRSQSAEVARDSGPSAVAGGDPLEDRATGLKRPLPRAGLVMPQGWWLFLLQEHAL